MGIAQSLPKAWKKINEIVTNLTTKVDKIQNTDGDGALSYIMKTKKSHFTQGWYKIAEIEAYQSTTNTIFEIIGSTGYNEKAIHQECYAKVVVRGGNSNPDGLSVACFCIGNAGFITHTSYYKKLIQIYMKYL